MAIIHLYTDVRTCWNINSVSYVRASKCGFQNYFLEILKSDLVLSMRNLTRACAMER